jgi:GT2 family glycosyltransferase
MSKANYLKIGGFDERYCAGIGFEDEDFVDRVEGKGIRIVTRDDLVTAHLEHDKEYIDSHRDLVEVNRNIFLNRHSAGMIC